MAEESKEDLEKAKLKAEVDELKWKLRPANRRMEWIKVGLTFLAVAGTITGGMLGYFNQRQQALNQREAEEKFRISQEMIELVKQLNTRSDVLEFEASLQRNAAIELAYFGREAIPLLIENLDVPRMDVASDAIIRSLQLIIKSEVKRDEVLEPLFVFAEKNIARELEGRDPDNDLIKAQLNAIARLAATPDDKPGAEEVLRSKSRVLKILAECERPIRIHPEIQEAKREELLQLVDSLRQEMQLVQEGEASP